MLRDLALRLLRLSGASDTLLGKVRDRLLRVDDRLRAIAEDGAPPEASGSCGGDAVSLYPRLFHYLYFPEYNRSVLHEMAREWGCTPRQLLANLERHFAGVSRRLRFTLTPQTHGQHARSIWEEMRSWRVDKWEQSFSLAGFVVEDVVGCRYHHLLEWTPRTAWDTALYYLALPAIHAVIDRRSVGPETASEFIIVARTKQEGPVPAR